MRSRTLMTAAVVTGLALVAPACASSDSGASEKTTTTAVSGKGAPKAASLKISDADAKAVATTYADGVFATYDANVSAATELQTALDTLVAEPTDANLDAAKQVWLSARDVYLPTEVFRFYDGPIDEPDDGPEGQINAWPLDEAYIDYVEDDADAGIVNNVAEYPEVTADVLVEANEKGGETNISTGWHAIEFLLWGQDLSDTGPGERPVTDYSTAPNAERRATYLKLLGQQLVDDLTSVRDQWDPEDGEYRKSFLAEPDEAISKMLRGMGALSSGELAGERMAVPYETQDGEDEHSCFSDNTIADIVGDAEGIRRAYTADYEGVDAMSLADVVAKADPEQDAALMKLLDDNVAGAEELPGPFDQLIQGPDDDPGRKKLLTLIESLQDQGNAIAELAASMGYDISVEV